MNELQAGLTALCDGNDLPEGESKLHDGLSALFALYDGVAELNDGAESPERRRRRTLTTAQANWKRVW